MEIYSRTDRYRHTLKPLWMLIILAALLQACGSNGSDGAGQTTLVAEGAEPEVISSGHQFTEGPWWHPDGYLLFSDIPANRIYRWEHGGESEVYLEPSGNSNGIQSDSDGRIIIAQHAGRISAITEEGDLEVLVDSYEGRRLNSPNDLIAHSNGTIYFTDPPFGVDEADQELPFSGVFQLNTDGELILIYDEFNLPNGTALSHDQTRLYVNDTETGDIVVFNVDGSGRALNPELFASVGPRGEGGAADGMVTDTDGRVYTTSPAGLTIFEPDGGHLEDIAFDQPISNMDWGGDDLNELYITSSDLVYRLPLTVTGYKLR